MSEDDVPIVIDKIRTIRSKLFNHKTLVESSDINSFIQNETILPYHCENSPFINSEYGHILTGDLRIVYVTTY